MNNNIADNCGYIGFLVEQINFIKTNPSEVSKVIDPSLAIEDYERELNSQICPALQRLKTLTK